MEGLLNWFDQKPSKSRWPLVGVVLVTLVALVAVAEVLLPPAAPFAGALAGVCLFAAGYLAWHRLLGDDLRANTNFKGNYTLKERRIGGGVAVALWIVLVAGLSTFAPGPVIGTANVLFVLTLIWVVRASNEEAADQLAKYEAYQQRKAEEAEAAALAEEYRAIYADAFADDEHPHPAFHQ